MDDKAQKLMEKEHLDPQTAERKAANTPDPAPKGSGKTHTITIEYEPVNVGNDSPQDILDDLIVAVQRHNARIVSTTGGDVEPAPHTQEPRLNETEAKRMADEQQARTEKKRADERA